MGEQGLLVVSARGGCGHSRRHDAPRCAGGYATAAVADDRGTLEMDL